MQNINGRMAQWAKTSVRDVEFDKPKANCDDHFAIFCTEYAKMAITTRLGNVKFFPYGPGAFVLANECNYYLMQPSKEHLLMTSAYFPQLGRELIKYLSSV